MNKKQRLKNKTTANKLKYMLPPTSTCPKCKQLTHDGHYVPSSFGDPGFYICQVGVPCSGEGILYQYPKVVVD